MYISYWKNRLHIVCGFVSTIAALASHTSRISFSTNQRETYDRIQPLSSWLRNLLALPQTRWEVTSAIMCRTWRILYIIKEKVVKTVYIPASSNGCCFNPTGWCIGTPYHPFRTPWKIQVYILIHIIHIMIHAWLHLKGVGACCLPWWIERVLKAPCLCQRLVFFRDYLCTSIRKNGE